MASPIRSDRISQVDRRVRVQIREARVLQRLRSFSSNVRLVLLLSLLLLVYHHYHHHHHHHYYYTQIFLWLYLFLSLSILFDGNTKWPLQRSSFSLGSYIATYLGTVPTVSLFPSASIKDGYLEHCYIRHVLCTSEMSNLASTLGLNVWWNMSEMWLLGIWFWLFTWKIDLYIIQAKNLM